MKQSQNRQGDKIAYSTNREVQFWYQKADIAAKKLQNSQKKQVFDEFLSEDEGVFKTDPVDFFRLQNNIYNLQRTTSSLIDKVELMIKLQDQKQKK